MSRPIQTLTPGFLSLLGLKNNGQLPPEMIDAVQPTIDMQPWYYNGTRELVPYSGVAQNILSAGAGYSFFNHLTVPPGEMWWVHSMHVFITGPAGKYWQGQAIHFEPGNAPIHMGPVERYDGNGLGGFALVHVDGFFAMPGDLFGVLTWDFTGAAVMDADASALISRFTR